MAGCPRLSSSPLWASFLFCLQNRGDLVVVILKSSNDTGFVVGMEPSFQTLLYQGMMPRSMCPQCLVMCREVHGGGLKFIPRHLCVRGRALTSLRSAPCLCTLPSMALWAIGRGFTHLDAHVGVVGISSGSQVLASSLGPQEVA